LLFEAVRLADTVIVRSWSEHGRLVDVVGCVRRDVGIVVNEDLTVPSVVAGERTDIVVYAPLYRADELAPFAIALGDLEVPVTIVARDRPTIAGRIRFEPPERAAAALGRARVIIDANGNDPGVALALAKLGRPLAVSSVSGATEILRGVRNYDVWNRRSILAAAVNGLSGSPPEIYQGRWEDRPRERVRPAFKTSSPLVSVVVATYNRPVLLAATLATIDRQTYPALEIIVVNDGGSEVRDVVARFPRARLIDQPENRGPAAARNRGLAEARGTFATFFDDDDEMFPDHIAALANALEQSGLDVAYGQLLNCCAVPGATGRQAGDALIGHTALLDHADVQWAGSLAPTAIMFRRALVDRIGMLDESLGTAEDYDFWLRLADGREWARVSDVTSMYFIRNDGTNYSAKNGSLSYLNAHQAIYSKHRSPRPLVQAGRTSMIEYFGGHSLAQTL
jgi:GT2 family glycosyltransferase